jgi:hypothetical protein
LPEDDDTLSGVRGVLIDSSTDNTQIRARLDVYKPTPSSLASRDSAPTSYFLLWFGLALGAEFQALQPTRRWKGRAIDLYQRFRDPHSSFDLAFPQIQLYDHWSGQPHFILPGTPLFLNVFNTVSSVMKENNLSAMVLERESEIGCA